ncbi:MAG: chemotaxis protein CheC, partial [Clostridia bacterium]
MNENINSVLSDEELDTIGEVMNISMGSAATALSTMLDKTVNITTPKIQQEAFSAIDNSMLEPAIIVKIEYVEGIDGTNVTMLRSNDMQIILDLLMGNEEPTPPEEFEFDDMSMSAACEVMNQMMGASATALSEILGMCVNISTPTATLVEKKADLDESLMNFEHGDQVIAIVFQLEIAEVLNTTFACFLSISLAQRIVGIVNADMAEKEEPAPAPAPQAEPAPIDYSQVDITQSQYTPPVPQDMSQMQGQPPMGQPPMGQPPMGQPPMGQPPMGQPPMGQPPM